MFYDHSLCRNYKPLFSWKRNQNEWWSKWTCSSLKLFFASFMSWLHFWWITLIFARPNLTCFLCKDSRNERCHFVIRQTSYFWYLSAMWKDGFKIIFLKKQIFFFFLTSHSNSCFNPTLNLTSIHINLTSCVFAS